MTEENTVSALLRTNNEEGGGRHPRQEDVDYVVDYVQKHKQEILRLAQRVYDHNDRDDHFAYMRHVRFMHVAMTSLDTVVGLPSTANFQRKAHNLEYQRGPGVVSTEVLKEIWGPDMIRRDPKRAELQRKILGGRAPGRRAGYVKHAAPVKAQKPAAPTKAPEQPKTRAVSPEKSVTQVKAKAVSGPQIKVTVYHSGGMFEMPLCSVDKFDATVEALKTLLALGTFRG